jgi:hypothetical protein
MRTAIVTLMILAIAGSAIAADLGATRDQKASSTYQYQNPVVHRQGGDTIFDATVIPGLPYNDTGTTLGYFDDYDEICPYTGSTSPDVVYTFTPTENVSVLIDLCGSAYDTKLYVYDGGLGLVACNDDFYFDDVCGVFVSALQNVPLTAGQTYYIVIDGYGGDAGAYTLLVEGFEPCVVPCPPDAVLEGEPHLGDGYEDMTNGGCNSPEFGNPFTMIDWINVEEGNPYNGYAWLCARSGWYVGPTGGDTRDTDWFSVTALSTGTMEFTVESEYPCYMFTLAPTDCASTGVVLQATSDCEAPATLTFPVVAGTEYWLWVGPTTFTGPVTEFYYVMYVNNNQYDVVGTEDMSFGDVKALFR